MKALNLTLFLLSIYFSSLAGGNHFYIVPKGTGQSTMNGIEPAKQRNSIGGFFRLSEYSTVEQKMVEADLVTYFIAKRNEKTISFSVNCARPMQLHYVMSDSKHKRNVKIAESSAYQRFEKEIDISRFRDGVCSIAVYNEKNELIHTIFFEKVAL